MNITAYYLISNYKKFKNCLNIFNEDYTETRYQTIKEIKDIRLLKK